MSQNEVLRPGWLREEVNKATERVGQLSNRQTGTSEQQAPTSTGNRTQTIKTPTPPRPSSHSEKGS
jgi:hypothetical protein